MRIVSTAWIAGSVDEFEAACCLQTHASLGLATASVPFDIYILEGFEKLDEAFTSPLAARHIHLHDLTESTRAHLQRYPGLGDLLGPSQGSTYEALCFLRWLVLEEQLAGEPFLHIDLDLFFQQPFDDIAAEFVGLSGTFGSPCLTAVGRPDWLATYRSSLVEMLADRTAFQTAIGYGGSEFRRDISSDQDLVQALELCGRLPRHGLSRLFDRYQVFINPIWPYQHKPAAPMTHAIVDGLDTIDGKPVLFWHLQNNFADYLSRFAVVSDYEQSWLKPYLPVRLGLPFIQLQPSAENFAFQALRDLAWSRISATFGGTGSLHDLGAEKYFARTWVSEWFILQKNGRGLFSSFYWWENGVFSSTRDDRTADLKNQTAFDLLTKRTSGLAIHDRDHILRLIVLYGLNGTAVEVGTFNGTFANEILDKTGIARLNCVDPYAVYDDFKDAINDMDVEAIFAQAQRFLAGHGDRVVFVRDFSEPASRTFEDGSLDLVYIDGNHQSAYVTTDLQAWWPKVREGGLVIGDDCVDTDDAARNAAGDITFVHRRKDDGTPDLYGDYGVLHAVRKFVSERELGYVVMGSQFVIPK